jgi:hypothetical protein
MERFGLFGHIKFIKNKKILFNNLKKSIIMKSVVKKTLFTVGLSLSLLSCSKQDPVEYNNQMMNIINTSEDDMSTMNSAMMSNDFNKAEEVRKKWLSKLEKQIKDIEAMGDFNGDASFKNAVSKAMKKYKEVVATDYSKLIEIRKTPDESKIQEEETVLNNINNKLEEAANELNKASTDFTTTTKK